MSMTLSNITVQELNDAVACAEDAMRNCMGSADAHEILEGIYSLTQNIDVNMLASGQTFVPEERLKEFRKALLNFMGKRDFRDL